MLNLEPIVSAVQRNCHIADARHAGDLSMCTFLMKMREFYRWENELSFSNDLEKNEVGEWLNEREHMWEGLESSPFASLPLPSGAVDPFDAARVNDDLVPHGYVYSAGYGRFCRPHFFLADLVRRDERDGFTIFVSSCEYARDLEAPPAMLQERSIFIRRESAQRFLWEKIEEWRWNRRNQAMARALATYDFDGNFDGALAAMTQNETDAMILHELGEGRAGELLGESWPILLRTLARSKTEIMARAVRDLLADCLVTLPRLAQAERTASLHFYFANFTGMRRHLFPEALAAYEGWHESGDVATLLRFAGSGRERWLATARQMLSLFEQHGDDASAAIESLLEPKAA